MFLAGVGTALAQTSATLDGTSGANTISTNYTTTTGLNLGLGFFAEYLIVGGGGGGGGDNAGGGGGGGVLTNAAGTFFRVVNATNTVVVGVGGAGGTDTLRGTAGGNSSVFGLTAIGGGAGATGNAGQTPTTGGSGGGGDGEVNRTGAAGTTGQGFSGGNGHSSGGGGGGGGAGQVGFNATGANGAAGGAGVANAITGTTFYFGGGGGGGSANDSTFVSAGGLGGGGAGRAADGDNGTNGLGGGGGGASWSTSANRSLGGDGGSGVVMIRFAGGTNGVTGGTTVAGTGSAAGTTIQRFTTTGTSSFVVDLSARLGATLTGTISGAGGVTYSGPGRLVLAADNSYAGTTTISAGTLQVGNGGTTGTLGGGAVTNNGALTFDRSDTATVANAISGSGSLTQQGGGTTVLTGANTYSGTTAITSGTLQVGNGGTAGTLGGAGNIENAGTLAFRRSDNVTLSRAVTGAGQLAQDGAGTLILTGDNTYAGTTTISSGTLQVGNGGTAGKLGNGAVSIAAGANLAFHRSDSVGVANVLQGDGSVTKNGANVLTLSGNNSYAGGTVIQGGTLVAAANSALGSGVVTLAGGQLMIGTGVSLANQVVLSGSAGGTMLGSGLAIDYLLVAGGGGGGGDNGGGGGGGGVIAGATSLNTANHAIVVGAGGAGGGPNIRGSSGGNSAGFGQIAIGGGGGGGGATGEGSLSGGSGGGGDGEVNHAGSPGTAGQGFAGGNGVTGGKGAPAAGVVQAGLVQTEAAPAAATEESGRSTASRAPRRIMPVAVAEGRPTRLILPAVAVWAVGVRGGKAWQGMERMAWEAAGEEPDHLPGAAGRRRWWLGRGHRSLFRRTKSHRWLDQLWNRFLRWLHLAFLYHDRRQYFFPDPAGVRDPGREHQRHGRIYLEHGWNTHALGKQQLSRGDGDCLRRSPGGKWRDFRFLGAGRGHQPWIFGLQPQ